MRQQIDEMGQIFEQNSPSSLFHELGAIIEADCRTPEHSRERNDASALAARCVENLEIRRQADMITNLLERAYRDGNEEMIVLETLEQVGLHEAGLKEN